MDEKSIMLRQWRVSTYSNSTKNIIRVLRSFRDQFTMWQVCAKLGLKIVLSEPAAMAVGVAEEYPAILFLYMAGGHRYGDII